MVTRVGFTSANSGSANITIPIPGGTAAGDVAVVFVTQRLGGGVLGTAAGWTIIPGFTFPASMNDGCQGWYRVLTGGDTNPTFTHANISGQGITGVMGVYRGVDTTIGPIAYSALGTLYGTAVGPKNVPARTTEIANVTLLNMIGVLYVSTAPTVTNANGFTNQVAIGVGTSWPCHSTLLDKDVTNGYESQDSATLTTSYNAWNIMVALVDAVQPNRFALYQGSTASVLAHNEMPEVYVGTKLQNQSATITPVIPAGARTNDVLIAAVWCDGFSCTPPAGWTTKADLLEPATSRRLYCATHKYTAGDPNPTFTMGHSSSRQCAVVVGFHNADTFDHSITATRNTSLDHAGPTLNTLDDAYNYLIQFNMRYYDGGDGGTQIKAGADNGFVQLFEGDMPGAGGGITCLISGKPQLGSASVTGPTITHPTVSAGGAIMLAQIQAMYQPVYLEAVIQQASTASVAMHQDVGFPIEVHMQEANHASVNMRTAFARRKPQRELVWIHNYSGERIGVVD